MTDVLLINPRQGKAIYQGLGHLTACEPPLWTRLIAGYLKDRDWTVTIWDDDAGIATPCAPRLVVIAAYGHQPNASTQSMTGTVNMIRELREMGYRGPICIVGGHASALPEETEKETGAMVIVGEGPVTIDALLRGETEPQGLYPHKAPPLLSCDDLHGNVWDCLPPEKYRAHNWQCFNGSPRSPYASIYTSLGCPYKCVFCPINAPFGKPGYRTRRPEDVVAEVRMLHDTYGVQTFKIADEMFVLKPSHYLPICEGLAALPFADELNIWAYARIDTVKPDTLALMRRAGIRWLALGIESGSAHVRDGAAKSINEQDIHDIVAEIRKAGIWTIGNFIFGLPDDTTETMQATLDLARSLNCEFANFYSAMAYPGSRLYSETDPSDLPASWSGYSQHSRDTRPLPTETVSSADVLRFRDDAFHTYFSDSRYLDMVQRTFGDAALQQVMDMATHRLERAA